ncbi:MFS transporter [Tenggerimyces flavus]|uniref:MFS transporter n=1 Tax=Tenggerimyces flavus TaxID=1708749 RepID=A0ABV7YH67_9ACTN|nr:MFS transporter [Tenggerimyces flavus]MBM7786026.1 DHA1 family inner membrane transport protein [Tenggerimyces flavus]
MPVLSLMLVVFSLTTGEFVPAGILPDVADDLNVSLGSAGLLVTAYALGMIVGGPVVTVLTARYARKQLIAGLVGFAILANLASAIVPHYLLVLATRFAAGLVVATFFAVAIAIAIATAKKGRESSAVARLAAGMSLGLILGAPIGTFVGQHLGWRATFVAVAAIAAMGLLMVLRFVPAQAAAATSSVANELRVFKSKQVWLAIALTALGNVGVVTVFTYFAPLATDVAGFDAEAVPVLLLVYGAGSLLGNFVGGWLSDRALVPSLVGMLAVLAGALVLLKALGDTQAAFAVLAFVLGALAFAIVPGLQTLVVSSASAAPTLAVAVNASGYQVAAAFAGWLGGQLIAGDTGMRNLPLVSAGLTVLGLLVALTMLRQSRTGAQV